MSDPELAGLLRARFRSVDGHSDVWRWFHDGAVFGRVVAALATPLRDGGVTKVAGIEARGFILGGAVAARLGVGFVALRTPGSLFPGEKLIGDGDGPDYRGRRARLALQRAACGPGDVVGLVDDWFETGSQGRLARSLIERTGAGWGGASIIVDQLGAGARARLAPYHALLDGFELVGEGRAGAAVDGGG